MASFFPSWSRLLIGVCLESSLLFLEVFLCYEKAMDRIRAMILLFALLGGTGAAVAQAAFNSSLECCTGGMCPVHMGHTKPLGKSQCDGMRTSDCPCSMDSSAANGNKMGGLTATDTATLQRRGAMEGPKSSRSAPREFPTRIPSGYIFSSEYPPRVPVQDNS
jgi:hypothetical protein